MKKSKGFKGCGCIVIFIISAGMFSKLTNAFPFLPFIALVIGVLAWLKLNTDD